MDNINIYGNFKIVDSLFMFNKLSIYFNIIIHNIETNGTDTIFSFSDADIDNIDKINSFIRNDLAIQFQACDENTIKFNTQKNTILSAIELFEILSVAFALCARNSYLRYYDITENELYDIYKDKYGNLIHVNTNQRTYKLIKKKQINKTCSKQFMRVQYYDIIYPFFPSEITENILNYVYPNIKKG